MTSHEKHAFPRLKQSVRRSFAARVQAVVAGIPKGTVMTYGAVAAAAGVPRAARAVGNILHRNLSPRAVPCHRVVRSDGSVGGYAFGGSVKKRSRLRREGVAFDTNGRVRKFVS